MVAIRTRFDGEKIEVPAALRGSAPADVIVVFDAAAAKSTHSIWDVVGKSRLPMSAEQIDAEIREERDTWNDR